MKLYLRANERFFLNGAVLRSDRKVAIELLNDATFLLENHVLQKEDVTSPLKQLYFVIQMMLIDPNDIEKPMLIYKDMIANLLITFENPALLAGIKQVDAQVVEGKRFNALKQIRKMYPLEEEILFKDALPEVEVLASSASQPSAKGL